MKNSTQATLPHFNFSDTAELNDVTSRLIILINEEINEVNCMVRNSTKLDRRTKQHTQFGVSTSDGSRDMARTKSWRKKKKKKKKKRKKMNASPTGIANYSNPECQRQKVNNLLVSFVYLRFMYLCKSHLSVFFLFFFFKHISHTNACIRARSHMHS